MRTKIAIVIGWFAVQGTLGLQPHAASGPAVLDNQGLSRSAITGGRDNPTANPLSRLWTDGAPGNGTGLFQAGGDRIEIATLITLPSLDRAGFSEAHAVNEAGTVIVGHSWARMQGRSLQHAVKWTLQNGSWAISSLPHAGTEAVAQGINNQGDAAGNDSSPSSPSHPILWPATGGFEVLGCNDNDVAATVYGISADEQIVVGTRGFSGATAAVWRPGNCRVDLPPLIDGGSAGAFAVNRDGTIVGGIAAISSTSFVAVRWMSAAGQWQIEQLDNRRAVPLGANGVGDLAGYAYVPCGSPDGCSRAVIWYAAGGSEDLGTLSYARDINATREVVGISTASNGVNTAFFWSESLGMLQLPLGKGLRWAAANSLSDVRPDGTRLIVGTDSRGNAVAWVVRNP
jgi:probable HAF family extracellular repeat protein